MIDEELESGGESIIPLMFECNLTLFPALFMQLGSVFEIVAPAVQNDESQFFLEGDYRTYTVRHSYTAGGSFETKITGMMDSVNSKVENSAKNKKPSPEEIARQGQDLYKKLLLDKEKAKEGNKAEETKDPYRGVPPEEIRGTGENIKKMFIESYEKNILGRDQPFPTIKLPPEVGQGKGKK